MIEQTHGTLARASKGPTAPPPVLDGVMATVGDTVASWPGVVATAHWDLYDASRIDGIDFYVSEEELGHIHLDGSIHPATNPSLGQSLVSAGLAQRFRYAHGWVQADIERIGAAGVVTLQKNASAQRVLIVQVIGSIVPSRSANVHVGSPFRSVGRLPFRASVDPFQA